MGEGNKGEGAKGPRRFVRSALSITLGAGTVLGGAYALSRIRETQEVETRLERLEQIVEKLSKENET